MTKAIFVLVQFDHKYICLVGVLTSAVQVNVNIKDDTTFGGCYKVRIFKAVVCKRVVNISTRTGCLSVWEFKWRLV